ncbi:MAG: hypothetical protein ACP5O0_09090 [Acidimicrobiales bacterium]
MTTPTQSRDDQPSNSLRDSSVTQLYENFIPQSLITEIAPEGMPKVGFIARSSATLGIASLVLFILEILTIPLIATRISWHVIVGSMLTIVVLTKLGLAGYRFVAYYGGDKEFLKAGPPWIGLRFLAPLLAVVSILVLGSGFELIFAGPNSFSSSFLVPAHTLLSVVWLVLLGLHSLAYLRRSGRSIASDNRMLLKRRSRSANAGQIRTARIRLSILVLTLGLGLLTAYGVRGQVRSWAHELASHATLNTFTPFLPKIHSTYTRHEKILAKERQTRHLEDVKAYDKSKG